MKCTAIVLAAGQGKRMRSDIQKQYLQVNGYPVLYYSLNCFQKCPFINEIILVTGEKEMEFCRREFADKYQFDKITQIVAGGKERYHSVYNGLLACSGTDYVFVHDGARPFVTESILQRGLECVKRYHACAAGVLSKDTIKIVDEERMVTSTPDRSHVWNVQTPQIFDYHLLLSSYKKMMETGAENITDDAMVVEQFGAQRVYMFEGSYKNIKITTPEDLGVAEVFVHNI